jgi:hypothetical protein
VYICYLTSIAKTYLESQTSHSKLYRNVLEKKEENDIIYIVSSDM